MSIGSKQSKCQIIRTFDIFYYTCVSYNYQSVQSTKCRKLKKNNLAGCLGLVNCNLKKYSFCWKKISDQTQNVALNPNWSGFLFIMIRFKDTLLRPIIKFSKFICHSSSQYDIMSM